MKGIATISILFSRIFIVSDTDVSGLAKSPAHLLSRQEFPIIKYASLLEIISRP